MRPLVLASGNADKAREVCEVLADAWNTALVAWAVETDSAQCFVIQTPDDPFVAPAVTDDPDVEESGATLLENARIKAAAWAKALGMRAIADDTGLFVDALNGEPGVRSARYAGEHASYADNVERLLEALRPFGPSERHAHFATVAIAVDPDGREIVARGEVRGEIAMQPAGDGGFGYDPLFVPVEGDGRTFAQMSAAEKHAISHRGRAFNDLAAKLGQECEDKEQS